MVPREFRASRSQPRAELAILTEASEPGEQRDRILRGDDEPAPDCRTACAVALSMLAAATTGRPAVK